jgi:broad specificity phosphatase PhoE
VTTAGGAKVLTVHLIRHGETEASRDHRFCGLRDCPLSDFGRQQVEALTRHWSDNGDVRAVYASPLSRCRLLAEAIAARRGVPLHVEEGLREIDHGSWDGRREDEVRATEPEIYRAYDDHPGIMAPHGGETGYQVAARALPVITRTMETYDGGDVLVISHKAVIRIVACALLGIDIDLYRARLAQPVASVTSFDMGPDGPLLRRLGDLSHLPIELRIGGGV